MVDKLMGSEAVTASTDQWSSPTLNTIIGKAFVKLLEMMFAGTLHVVGPRLSRYEFTEGHSHVLRV